MKTFRNISLVFTLLLSSYLTMAQEESGPAIAGKYPAIESRVKKSNADIENPKKNIKAKTFLKRAELMMEVYDLHNILIPGTQAFQVRLYLGAESAIETIQEDGKTLQKYIFERVTVTFENESLVSYEETGKFVEGPLQIAMTSLKKADELDVEKKIDEDIQEAYEGLKKDLQTEAIGKIQKEDYAGALLSFEDIIEIDQLARFESSIDTAVYYFAAYSSYTQKDYPKAIKYGEVARTNNYDDSYNYFILTKSYYEQNDSTNGLDALKEGFGKYPDNEYLINELINYYLVREQAEAALEYIDIAKTKNPDNASYAFAQGTLYDKLGEVEKALEAYDEAIAIKPTYFDAYYNKSVLIYNKAVQLYNDAVSAPDDKYEAMKAEGDEWVEKAIQPMEKAHEVKPEDTSAIENLKTYYYRLRSKGPDYQASYDKYKALLD